MLKITSYSANCTNPCTSVPIPIGCVKNIFYLFPSLLGERFYGLRNFLTCGFLACDFRAYEIERLKSELMNKDNEMDVLREQVRMKNNFYIHKCVLIIVNPSTTRRAGGGGSKGDLR